MRKGIVGSATEVVLDTMGVSSYHYCNSKESLFERILISEEIMVGNGIKMIAKKVGNYRCMVQQKNGEKYVFELQT
jgi:hypothetical protein